MRAAKVSPKKFGAPKTKGASRAKSGCYTCRIRRKKCDEVKNAQGSCGTCVRLRLECLGFGAKRPDYLKVRPLSAHPTSTSSLPPSETLVTNPAESDHVSEMREKIKSFLASQGMIKGHSGSAPRNAEREHVTLRLKDESGYSSSSSSDSLDSSPGPMSINGDDTHHILITSNTRDEKYYSQYDQPHLAMPSHDHQELSPDTIYSPSRLNHDVMFTALPHTSSSDSLVPVSYAGALTARVSTMPPSYRLRLTADDDDTLDFVDTPSHPPMFHPYHHQQNPLRPLQFQDVIQLYVTEVVELQYLLADRNITTLMIQTANDDEMARDAMHLLSKITRKQRHLQGDPDIRRLYRSIQRIFLKSGCQQGFTADDAIAALHTVSTFLFLGGTGNWRQWLTVAYIFSDEMLRQPYLWSSPNFPQTEKLCFILSTAMWFDVLASVTLNQEPHFLDAYRVLFNPTSANARANAMGMSGIGFAPGLHPPLSMMTVMGCENVVVWAMAEVAHLSLWKAEQKRCGRLSIPELANRGRDIDQWLLPHAGPLCPYAEMLGQARQHTADIFRASTRLYLHSVLSDDCPYVPEIKVCVADTINCLKKVCREDGDLVRKTVRSVVFSIYLCGCLAETEEQVNYLSGLLSEQEQDRVGNCGVVRNLMEQVWEERKASPVSSPVRWRHALQEQNLLLV